MVTGALDGSVQAPKAGFVCISPLRFSPLSGPFKYSLPKLTSKTVRSLQVANRILNMHLFSSTLTQPAQTLSGPTSSIFSVVRLPNPVLYVPSNTVTNRIQ